MLNNRSHRPFLASFFAQYLRYIAIAFAIGFEPSVNHRGQPPQNDNRRLSRNT